MTIPILAATLAALLLPAAPGTPPQTTYCNPVNLDYAYCPIPDFVRQGKHRTSADPAIVTFRAMDLDRPYYFAIGAFNENGVSRRSPGVKAD